MLFNIKARLATLGKRSVDLIETLAKNEVKVSPADFSNFINGRIKTPKANEVLTHADNILKEWEAEKEALKHGCTAKH